jgi:transcriptional regulator
MYIPPAFKVKEFEKLAAVMRHYSFATLVTQGEDGPFATHLPILFDPEPGPYGRLSGHLARANPQWRHFLSGQEALVIFQGPHAYISPSWYQAELAVPTWNYVAVHAYGPVRLIEDEKRLRALLQATIQTYEAEQPQPWPGDLPEEYVAKLIKAIAGFELPIRRLEGKFKLGQNRPAEDLAGVYQALAESPRAGDRQLAAVMVEEVELSITK